MAAVWSCVRGLSWLAMALGGCGRAPIETTGSCGELAPGDLVITEVHANPDGSDGKDEYIELFNARAVPLALDGLALRTSRTDGVGEKTHRLFDATVDVGEYFVLGNGALDALPAHLDYSYDDALGSLRNSDATVSIWCGEKLIDEVIYRQSTDGRSLQLDGGLVPNHESNSEERHWCDAPEGADEVSPGNFGSPGLANLPCGQARVEGSCLEDGASRVIRGPNPGDVRITEWMANPHGQDAELEWVEAHFGADVHLNGFQLGPAPDALHVVVDQAECFPVGAGQRVVFGASPAAAPRVDAGLGFSLGNSGLRSILAGVGGTVLDRVDYESTVEGVAWQLDPDQQLCLAALEDEYATENFGTPGEANPACPQSLGPGECFDGGAPRAVVHPLPGQARIVEWMADPSAVGNREGEWIEVRIDTDADLNGLILSDLAGASTAVESEDCLTVSAGAHVVFARSLDPLRNGGIEAAQAQLTLSLNNREESITLGVAGATLDAISYARSEPGAATQVDEHGEVCTAAVAYGDGDLGTPGLANPSCR